MRNAGRGLSGLWRSGSSCRLRRGPDLCPARRPAGFAHGELRSENLWQMQCEHCQASARRLKDLTAAARRTYLDGGTPADNQRWFIDILSQKLERWQGELSAVVTDLEAPRQKPRTTTPSVPVVPGPPCGNCSKNPATSGRPPPRICLPRPSLHCKTCSAISRQAAELLGAEPPPRGAQSAGL